jgi:hypothetical protein
MLKVITLAALATVAIVATTPSNPAQARGGAIAAGVIGGLAVGAIVGSQQRDYYGGPGYAQPYYQPTYGACHVEREQYEDQYGRVRTHRIRVCD